MFGLDEDGSTQNLVPGQHSVCARSKTLPCSSSWFTAAAQNLHTKRLWWSPCYMDLGRKEIWWRFCAEWQVCLSARAAMATVQTVAAVILTVRLARPQPNLPRLRRELSMPSS